MNQAVTEYLRECGRLLKWVFFQPSKLRAHIRQIAPEVADKERSFAWLREAQRNAELRRFLIQTVLVIVVLPFAVDILVGLTVPAFGGHFSWTRSLSSVAVFIALCVALSVAGNVAFSVVCGIAGGIAFGVVEGVAHGVASDLAFGVTHGVAFGVVGGVVGGVAGGVVAGVAFGVVLGVVGSVVSGVVGSVVVGVMENLVGGIVVFVVSVVVGGVAATKFYVYLFEIWPAIKAYRRSLTSNIPEQELQRSPIGFDESVIWPQPYLASLLLRIAEKNLDTGLQHFCRVASYPYQRWAMQKATRKLLEEQQISFFDCLNRLLSNSVSYHATGDNWIEETFAEDRYFTAQIWLAELAGFSPVPRKWDKLLADRIARAMTLWLRTSGRSLYEQIAQAYFYLLRDAHDYNIRDDEAESTNDGGSRELFESADNALAELADLRTEPHGEEFFQTMRLTIEAWQCESLREVSGFRDTFAPLFELEQPLRPQIVTVFRRLRDAAVDAASFLTAAHELTRKDALLKAGGVLEEARQLANDVYEPERSLLLAVIEHWRRMFAIEGGRVAQRQEVEILPNPYVAGRPIRPEDGQLFAGRREEMKLIEEKLQTGVGIVIYGQRRIGKTSILLHLRERLPHHLLPVYLNLQTLMANTTSGFLYAVAREIAKQMRDAVPGASATGASANELISEPGKSLTLPGLQLPSAEEFTREPYLSFNHLLEQIEARLQPGQRVLLSFDEFEELEQRVKAGKIEPEIFAYLRGVTQTGSRFALLFAGLHTLEQMTREYWNPFFASVQTIRVGYLSELDAEQLIRDPIEQFPLSYELEAVNRITELTNSHPYLTQSLCHNLVNRLNDPLNRSNKAKQEDVDAVIERTLESSGYYFDDFVWGWSNWAERIALSLLAEKLDEGAGEAAFSIVENRLGREAALTATRNLVARDILSERTSEIGELVFRFQIPLAQMWVKQKKPSARILMEGGRL